MTNGLETIHLSLYINMHTNKSPVGPKTYLSLTTGSWVTTIYRASPINSRFSILRYVQSGNPPFSVRFLFTSRYVRRTNPEDFELRDAIMESAITRCY